MLHIIKEDNFFTFLSGISASLSGVIVSLLVGENFFNASESQTSFKYFGSCILWEQSPFSNDILIVLSYFSVVFTFGTQIVLYFKHMELEKQRARGIMVATYKRDGVTISTRREDQSSCHKLINFDRTVVAPKASFLAFISTVVRVVFYILLYAMEGSTDPSFVFQFAIYVEFCVHFFIFTLIETIFSQTLFNTLIDYIPCRRRSYNVVNA